MKLRATVLLLCLSAPVAAQAPDREAQARRCAETFPERLEDARQALRQHRRFLDESERVMPWFNEHCRLLEHDEIVARRLNDPNAFVCDTQQGRPAGLTSRFVLEHSVDPPPSDFYRRWGEDVACEPFDREERAKLTAYDGGPTETVSIYCYQDSTERCDKMREIVAQIARLRSEQQRRRDPAATPPAE